MGGEGSWPAAQAKGSLRFIPRRLVASLRSNQRTSCLCLALASSGRARRPPPSPSISWSNLATPCFIFVCFSLLVLVGGGERARAACFALLSRLVTGRWACSWSSRRCTRGWHAQANQPDAYTTRWRVSCTWVGSVSLGAFRLLFSSSFSIWAAGVVCPSDDRTDFGHRKDCF